LFIFNTIIMICFPGKLQLIAFTTIFSCLSVGAIAQPEIPKTWPKSVQEKLQKAWDIYQKDSAAYDKKVIDFNARCGHIRTDDKDKIAACQKESDALDIESKAVDDKKIAFWDSYQQAKKDFPEPPVVDGRTVPSGLPKGVEDAIIKTYSNAPEGVSRWVLKGFQDIQSKDWLAAKACFGSALLRDPNNENIKRLIDLSDYTIEAHKEADRYGTGKTPYNKLTNIEKDVLNTWIQRVRVAAKDDVYVDATSDLPASALDKVRKYVYGLNDAERDKLFFPDKVMIDIIMHDMIK
jgi:hypothetical protein